MPPLPLLASQPSGTSLPERSSLSLTRAGNRSAASTAGCSGPGRNRQPTCYHQRSLPARTPQPRRPTTSSPPHRPGLRVQLTARHAPLLRVLFSVPFPTCRPSGVSSPCLSRLPPRTDRLPGLALCRKAARTRTGLGREAGRTDSRAARSRCGPDPGAPPTPSERAPIGRDDGWGGAI